MCVKKGEASITSLVSAFGRAYHSEFDNPKIFDDYVAKEFISQKERNDIEMNIGEGRTKRESVSMINAKTRNLVCSPVAKTPKSETERL
ncbi:class I SAM-dependent methyltransferase, partial [Bacillus cereus]